jgi:hypothetical protein
LNKPCRKPAFEAGEAKHNPKAKAPAGHVFELVASW